MSYNEVPEEIRQYVFDSLDATKDDEYAAAIILESIDDGKSYEKKLGEVITEIVSNTSLEFAIDDGEVVVR